MHTWFYHSYLYDDSQFLRNFGGMNIAKPAFSVFKLADEESMQKQSSGVKKGVLKNFKNTFFYKTPLVTASVNAFLDWYTIYLMVYGMNTSLVFLSMKWESESQQ